MSDFLKTQIPHTIHQIWIKEELPRKFKHYQESWQIYQEKGWRYKLWHNQEIRELLSKYFPYLVDCYDIAHSDLSKSNFARYAILYLFGGVYVDINIKSNRDISGLIDNREFVVFLEKPHRLSTCIIASIVYHPVLASCLNYYEFRKYDPYQLSCLASGAVFFSKRFGEYVRKYGESSVAVYNIPMILQNHEESLWESSYTLSPINITIVVLLGMILILLLTWAIYHTVKCY